MIFGYEPFGHVMPKWVRNEHGRAQTQSHTWMMLAIEASIEASFGQVMPKSVRNEHGLLAIHTWMMLAMDASK